nr:MAG TPA: hypothetical protein [Caudoviricetes sp.]
MRIYDIYFLLNCLVVREEVCPFRSHIARLSELSSRSYRFLRFVCGEPVNIMRWA